METSDPDLVPFESIVKCGWKDCSEMANLKACSRCKSIWYCCVDHQRLDWKTHKLICKDSKSSGASIKVDASTPKTQPFDPKAQSSNKIELFKWREMPTDIASLYSIRKGMTIRHGYNIMDDAVKTFFEAMKHDSYPIEESEGVFGIQMVPKYERYDNTTRVSMGNLVYLVWMAMWKAKEDTIVWKNEIVMMILMGKLPEWFQLEVMEFVNTNEGKNNAYVHELIERGMDNIRYDILLVRFRWGDITEEDIKMLTSTA